MILDWNMGFSPFLVSVVMAWRWTTHFLNGDASNILHLEYLSRSATVTVTHSSLRSPSKLCKP